MYNTPNPIYRNIKVINQLTVAVVPVVFCQRGPVDALWETEESDCLERLLLLLLLKSRHPISLKVNKHTSLFFKIIQTQRESQTETHTHTHTHTHRLCKDTPTQSLKAS